MRKKQKKNQNVRMGPPHKSGGPLKKEKRLLLQSGKRKSALSDFLPGKKGIKGENWNTFR